MDISSIKIKPIWDYYNQYFSYINLYIYILEIKKPFNALVSNITLFLWR
jgi:hypothetical protein